MVQPTANTELTIAFIRIIESIMCLLCLIGHINALKDEEPMPHIVLFCGTFGGFFILSLAKLVVPLSGQLSPPGVDLVFSFLGFILFYSAACAALFFLQRDPHLIAIDGIASSVDEESHPFFKRCVNHAILSIVTGTLFLMHTVISADRLDSILRGIEEDVERKLDQNDIDIHPDDTICLHLFFYNWLIVLWNTTCFKSIRKVIKKSKIYCIEYYRKRERPSYISKRRINRSARLLTGSELLRGITLNNILPDEFIRNPRRSLLHNNVIFPPNENIIKATTATPEQGPSSQTQNKINIVNFDNSINQEKNISKTNQKKGVIKETQISFIRNEEFDSDEDIPSTPKNQTQKKVNISFIRNVEFDRSDDETSKKSTIAFNIRRTQNKSHVQHEAFADNETIQKTKSIMKSSIENDYDNELTKNKKKVSFIRNRAFDSVSSSKFINLFKWFPRKRGTIVQNIEVENLNTIELFAPKLARDLPPVKSLQVIDNDTSSETEISTFKFRDKSDSSTHKTPDTNFIPFTNTFKNTEQNQNKETSAIIPDSESFSHIIQIPQIVKPKNIAFNEQSSDLPSPKLLLTSTVNKESKITVDSTADEEQGNYFPVFNTTSYMEEIRNLIPTPKISEIIIEKVKCDLPSCMKDDIKIVPFEKVESTSENNNKQIDYQETKKTTNENLKKEITCKCVSPELISSSYPRRIIGFIDSNRNTENVDSSEKKKKTTKDDEEKKK